MSRVILSILFFLLLTPLAFICRLLNGDELQLTKKDSKESYWTERNHAFEKNDLADMW